ncbi:MAG TPA: hypothetical protein PK596_06880 [Bacteroidales bacterium]|nr:hypothetical protein [Bacteroidales bacterium]
MFDHHPDGLFVGGSEDGLPPSLTGDEACPPELLDVVGDCGRSHIDGAGHLAHGRSAVYPYPAGATAPFPDLFEYRQPGFIGESLEGIHEVLPIDCLFLRLGHGSHIL